MRYMKRRHINVSAATAAPAHIVYSFLIYGTTWPNWSPIDSFELEREGTPPPEGVGAIRVFRRGRTTGRDEIIELVPERKLAYASRSGVPVRDYVGEITLDATPKGGTEIAWHSSFFAKAPGSGWILQRALTSFLDKCVHGLADASDQALARRTAR